MWKIWDAIKELKNIQIECDWTDIVFWGKRSNESSLKRRYFGCDCIYQKSNPTFINRWQVCCNAVSEAENSMIWESMNLPTDVRCLDFIFSIEWSYCRGCNTRVMLGSLQAERITKSILENKLQNCMIESRRILNLCPVTEKEVSV